MRFEARVPDLGMRKFLTTNLTRDEEAELMRYSRSIIIKGARSPERLLDEVTLFLHKVEADMTSERRTMLRTARGRDRVFEGRRVLLVDDDVRNIFALTSALEQRGAIVEIGRNGREALEKLDRVADIDEFLQTLRRVADGGTAIDPEVVAQLLSRNTDNVLDRLSPRETEVLAAMAEGLNNAGIAARTLARTADAIWAAAGDRSADFSWYTRRATVAAVYAATLTYWLREPVGMDEALAFLDRRLAGLARLRRPGPAREV